MPIKRSNRIGLLPCGGMLPNPSSLGTRRPGDLGVRAADASTAPAAARLAAELGLPLLPVVIGDEDTSALSPQPRLLLVVTAQRLELHETGRRAPGAVCCDFLGELQRELAGPGAGRRRALARAVGLSPGATTQVVDATAGLGRDAFRLASLGCQVTAFERSPVVAALLADGLRRAALDPRTAATVAERLRLVPGDARDRLASGPAPDVVLIDPMYPPSRKTAAPSKELRLLRLLLGADEDAIELLAAARAVARRRVVVKRRAHDPPLGGTRPDLVWPGRTTRFDVYLAPQAGN
jgi:16S rRNA (guanine1516-N2)-methyltransferase